MRATTSISGVLVLALAGCFNDTMSSASESATTGTATAGATTQEPGSAGATGTGGPTTTGTEPPTGGMGGTGGTSTGDGTSTGEATTAAPCGTPRTLAIEAPNVMLLIDKSGSMVAEPAGFWDHDGDPMTATVTRWRSLHEVLSATLATFEQSMSLGLVLFPSKSAKADYSEVACVVAAKPEVEPGPMHAADILAALPPALANKATIQGATPTARAVDLAVQTLAPGKLGKGVIVLVTDGAANCAADEPDTTKLFESYDAALLPAVTEAYTAGIVTHVVGIAIPATVSSTQKDGNPDSVNAKEKLDELAVAGGAPLAGETRFHAASNQSELQAALASVIRQVIPCTLEIEPPPQPDAVEITVAGVTYDAQVSDCAVENGWMYANAETTAIALCGVACSAFQETGQVEATFGCAGE